MADRSGSGAVSPCPVCGDPDGGHELCPVCRWQLRSDPVLGEATEADHKDAQTALEGARHLWDEGAERRARAVPPVPDETAESAVEDPPDWQRILLDLLTGGIPELLIVEFDADQVRVARTTADRNGVPGKADEHITEWRSIVPSLDSAESGRAFQLAGGIGELPLVERAMFDAAVGRWLERAVVPAPGGVVVLVRSRPGWILLDRAAAVLRARHDVRVELHREPAAAGTGAREPLAHLLRAAPLLVDHVLLLARTDPRDGRVRIEERVLFPAGTRVPPGGTVTARVPLHGGIEDNASVVVPLLAGRHAAKTPAPTVLTVRHVALPALGSAEFAFVLHGPGEIDVLTADGTPVPARTGPGATAAVPALPALGTGRILPPPPLHLVCAVELAGATVEEAAERIAFLRELVEQLSSRLGRRGRLRVGAVGYYDHLSKNRYSRVPTLVLTVPLAPAASALATLATWRPVRRARDSASALEDALQATVTLTADRPGSRVRPHKVLLVLGRRPPGLPETVGLVPACAYGIDWRRQMGRLRAQGVRVVARADPPTDPPSRDRTGLGLQRYTEESWRELAAQGSFRPGTDSALDVARDLAPPWRTEGPDCPLAFSESLL